MIFLHDKDQIANNQNTSSANTGTKVCSQSEYILFCEKIDNIIDIDEITAKISDYIAYSLQTCLSSINNTTYNGKMDCIHQINNTVIEEVKHFIQKIVRLLRKKNKKLHNVCQELRLYDCSDNNLTNTSSIYELLYKELIINLKKAHYSTFDKNVPFQDQKFSSNSLIQGSFLAYKARIKREVEQYFKSHQNYFVGLFEDLLKIYKEKAWEFCVAQFNGSPESTNLVASGIPIKPKNIVIADSETLHLRPLLDSDFFPDLSLVPANKIFPVIVLATMSSGKSTLINALLGSDYLPAQNKACTAKVYSILDDDVTSQPVLYVTNKDGISERYSSEIVNKIIQANENPSVEHILLIDQIYSFLNTDRILLLIDTPGPNNSNDKYHAQIAHKTLSKIHGGVLIYLINATQIGITDDKELLKIVREHVKNNPQLKVLAVINKIDVLDPEKEAISDIVANVKKYLEMNGLCHADVVPISALAAKLFKQVLAGKKDFTRLQRQQIEHFLHVYSENTPILSTYAWLSHGKDPRSIIEPYGYSIAQIENALLHTGIMWVEQYIQREQIICDK